METPDPKAHPRVTLGGKDYEVKYRVGDIVRLKKEHKIGIAREQIVAAMQDDGFDTVLKLLSAGISHSIQYTPEQLGDMIDLADFALYTQAVTDALGKVSPAAKAVLDKLATTAPPMTPATEKPN
jgi:hypothetical protein